MNKCLWPAGDSMTVKCPNCGNAVEVQISMVKENDLPCRLAECDNCHCDFDVSHDGKIELLRAPPKKSDPIAKKEFLERFEKLVFDPSIDN
ncbi:hypothetical protein [Pectobacterium carotovorum]|uniref:hypothetical protein n=1 Tax=Pectobacterium carotovorum TaxID=554 RepID=UPI0006899041|nr:hypothetical protein [Pectobacterium carotovorum]SHH69554.1 hypothetical protein SAMN05444147_11672 [Pectobacterium carotovorum]